MKPHDKILCKTFHELIIWIVRCELCGSTMPHSTTESSRGGESCLHCRAIFGIKYTKYNMMIVLQCDLQGGFAYHQIEHLAL